MRGAAMLALCLAACAPILPPDKLGEVERVREAPATKAAAAQAPAAIAHAEKLRNEALAAFDNDDLAGAQIIAERALAAYAEAVALARVARAEEVRVGAMKDADERERRLAELDVALQQLSAEINAQEKRLEVLSNLETPSASGSADGEREKARAAAVRTLALEARLLCVSAELLHKSLPPATPPPAALASGKEALGALDALLAAEPKAAPIDQARRTRAACLEALTMTRRAADDKSAGGSADAVLVELSQLGFGTPSRDARGLTVTLRDLFQGDALAPAAGEQIRAVAEVAAKHPRFPVMVVVHAAGADKRLAARGAAVVASLRKTLGDARVADAAIAGKDAPLVDPNGPYAARNERVDIVLVSPQPL